MTTIQNPVWLITGCSTGFGRTLAQQVLAGGHRVIVSARRKEQVEDLVAGFKDTALAVELEHGNRHTAIMHSRDVKALTKMGREIQTTIFVKNGPSFAGLGIGGEGYGTWTIAGPTGEGLTRTRNFARVRRCVLVDDLNVR